MENLQAQRVQERLTALGINPFEAARRANLERSYVNDLLIGKKRSLRANALGALAEALDCDPEYLSGIQSTPRAMMAEGGMKLAGVIEPNVWRESAAPVSDHVFPISPSPLFPAERQALYQVRGGPFDGALLLVLSPPPPLRDGDQVVVARRREGTVELSARSIEGEKLIQRTFHPGLAPLSPQDADVVGLIVQATLVYATPTSGA